MVFIIFEGDFKTRIWLLTVCIASTSVTLSVSTIVVLFGHIFDIAVALVHLILAISCYFLSKRTLVSVLLRLGREVT